MLYRVDAGACPNCVASPGWTSKAIRRDDPGRSPTRLQSQHDAQHRISGTEGYADEAEALVKQYESIAFADIHSKVLHLIPTTAARVLDIGAGTGRDAAGFAAMGHHVVAVEPTEALRSRAAMLHRHRTSSGWMTVCRIWRRFVRWVWRSMS